MSIYICGIFYSIQGETTSSGLTSVFIRLAGCNLNCRFCDTPEGRKEGVAMTIEEIIREVSALEPFNHVTLTGGEPLAQPESDGLISSLINKNYPVQVETNGSLPIKKIDQRARMIVDVKTPSSGEAGSFLMENLTGLKQGDELKFVIADREDYIFTKKFLADNPPPENVTVNLSPSFSELSAGTLAEWITRDRLNVRLNLQLHKIAGFK
jgi:7-carboxy-7-deazaguanine synthase